MLSTSRTKAGRTAIQSRRFWLTIPIESAQRPLVWEMSKKFEIIFNIRNATVTNSISFVALELTGERKTIQAAVIWLRRSGVQVDPIELNTVEG